MALDQETNISPMGHSDRCFQQRWMHVHLARSVPKSDIRGERERVSADIMTVKAVASAKLPLGAHRGVVDLASGAWH